MDVFDGETDLREPVQDMTLLEVFLLGPARCDGLGDIPALSILHDDLELVLLGGIYLDEADDAGMVKTAQYLGLLDGFLALGLAHVLDIHLLYHQQLVCLLLAHQIGLAKSSFPQQSLLLVDLVLRLDYLHLHLLSKAYY